MPDIRNNEDGTTTEKNTRSFLVFPRRCRQFTKAKRFRRRRRPRMQEKTCHFRNDIFTVLCFTAAPKQKIYVISEMIYMFVLPPHAQEKVSCKI